MDGVNLNGTNTNGTEQAIAIGLSAYQGPLDVLVWMDVATAAAYAPSLQAGFYFFTLNDQEDGYWLHIYNGSNLPLSIDETPSTPVENDPSSNVTEEDAAPENVTLYPSEVTLSEPASSSTSGVLPVSSQAAEGEGGATGSNNPSKDLYLRDAADTLPRVLGANDLDVAGVALDLSTPSAAVYTITLTTLEDDIKFYGADVTVGNSQTTYTFSHQDILDQKIYFAISDTSLLAANPLTFGVAVNGGAATQFDLSLKFWADRSGTAGNDKGNDGQGVNIGGFSSRSFYDGGDGQDDIDGFGGNAIDGGTGDDSIDLDIESQVSDETETVYYDLFNGGADVISNFTRGVDVLVLSQDYSADIPLDLAGYLTSISGDNPNELDDQDQLIVTVRLGRETDINSNSYEVISSLVFLFNGNYIPDDSTLSSSTMKIIFNEGIRIPDFIDLIGGIDNFDLSHFALKRLTDLEAILGEGSLQYQVNYADDGDPNTPPSNRH